LAKASQAAFLLADRDAPGRSAILEARSGRSSRQPGWFDVTAVDQPAGATSHGGIL